MASPSSWAWLQCTARAKMGTRGGEDGVATELINAMPFKVKLALWAHWNALLDGRLQRKDLAGDSWDTMLLTGFPKEGGNAVREVAQHRWVARSALL